MAGSKRTIIGGVDTHTATHHAAVVDLNGRLLADAEFPATPHGYTQLLGWMRSKGQLSASGWREPAPTAPALPAISTVRA
jgi:transposase